MTDKKIRIAHIHSYKNFIDRSTKCFEHTHIINIIFYLNKKNDYDGKYIKQAKWIIPNKKNVNVLIKTCSEFDIVVAYNLDGLKAYLINKLPKKTIIIWRFFGMELYGKMESEVLSVEEKKFFKQEPNQTGIRELIDPSIIKLKQYILWGRSMENERQKAFKNINYFLGLSFYEYNKLKERFELPSKFLQHPLALFNIMDTLHDNKSTKILIGNNRSAYNNYLEILYILRRNQKLDIEFYVQFSYGSESKYSEEVRRQMLQIKNVKLIDDFMEYEKYEALFGSMGAFVLNGYRQMGMGAVFNALVKGLKVYLNPKNIIFDWLNAEEFLVFDINSFEEDLENNNFNLSKAEKSINLEAYSNMSKRYSIELFQESMLNLS